MWKLGLKPRYSLSGNICFEISVFCLCSVGLEYPDILIFLEDRHDTDDVILVGLEPGDCVERHDVLIVLEDGHDGDDVLLDPVLHPAHHAHVAV